MVRIAEYLCTATGAVMLLAASLACVDAALGSRSALAAFEGAAAGARALSMPASEPDRGLWSATRKAAYSRSLEADRGLPEAVLAVPSLALEVPVFAGTGPWALNRGAGRLEETAAPGTTGNVAIAGHRDGFFRVLKDIELGTEIELRTLHGAQRFEVSDIRIVDPLDVSVLEPSNEAILTLITCYPFYYVGFAPDRFIVRARLVSSAISTELRARDSEP